MSEEYEEQYSSFPSETDLELKEKTTNPAWGREVTNELNNLLVQNKFIVNEEGKITLEKQKLWGLLSYLTRDLRLGNLEGQDYREAKYWLDVAGTAINQGLPRLFVASLSKCAGIIELSQSKKGFFRKLMKSYITETKTSHSETSKNKLLGGAKAE